MNRIVHTSNKKRYQVPQLKEWGTVAKLTQVGQTTAGNDVLPSSAQGQEDGSKYPRGLNR